MDLHRGMIMLDIEARKARSPNLGPDFAVRFSIPKSTTRFLTTGTRNPFDFRHLRRLAELEHCGPSAKAQGPASV